MVSGGQFHGINKVEQVFSAVGQNTNALVYVENIRGTTRAVIHHTLGLAEGVVHSGGVPPSRACPTGLQAVVVGEAIIGGHIQVRITLDGIEVGGIQRVRICAAVVRRQHRPSGYEINVVGGEASAPSAQTSTIA